ncbi:MAG TPA: RelA/SpoT domain-containing protein [Verrucomicrobiae bacterium]|nr:RelA/SpoT domain-containing protein [Verrucomicrobiae bacterium]
MKWAKPLFTRADVNDAARILLAPSPDHADVDQALSAVNNWRAIHAYPLQAVKMTLSNRAKHVERAALIAQRTKRIPAIVLKLQENHAAGLDMQLTQMHDIGGCRAILRSVGQVEQLVKVYAEATAKNALRGGKFHRKYDYIASPKPSGYRSVHLVYKYFTTTETHSVYNDLKIEIQIRSKLQHAWATAVETVDFFTGQALKSNIGEASWKRFFALVSNEFARLEKRPLVPGVPQTEAECKRELKSCSTQIGLLEGLTAATGFVEHKEGQLFLLELDLQNKTVTTTGFPREKALEAQDKYLEVERANRGNPNKQAVLVSVDSLAALPKAYPNFYLDISEFITVLRKVLA